MNYYDTYVSACCQPFSSYAEGRQHERDCERCQRILRGEPRFGQTYCSQCGEAFGPGEHGFSHCKSHEHFEAVED
jgi:hypothetical protein